VRVAPLLNKIRVLNKGKVQGHRGEIAIGGHIVPRCTLGVKEV